MLLVHNMCFVVDYSCDRRDTKISELIKSYDVYEDLMMKTNRGVQFYGKLDSTVKRLLERTCSACQTCEEERSKILERLAPKGTNDIYICSSEVRLVMH